MTLKFMGTKKGMTRIFDENGNLVVCTVIEAEPNIVSQVKQTETDGYEGVQLAAKKVAPAKVRNVSKALAGHYKKAGIDPRRHQAETRVAKAEEFKVGQEIGVGQFSDTAFVDVSAISKGKGYQGVIKRHHFSGGPAAHGSGFHRHGGSCGMRTSPGRCLPGQKKAGRMGCDMVTMQNLKVVKVDEENQALLVKGAIPGPRGSLVYISQAKKKTGQKKAKK